MINPEVVSKMENSRDKQLMQILSEKGKPYVKKHDGYAVKMEEDKQITYTDYDNAELTLTIPKGSYLMVGEDSCYPKIVTEKEWDDSNKFLGEEKRPGKEEPKIGIESYMG
ncbi:MAG: hypothetical protein PHT07_20935 [Paludibacter sp.]|nr:hypothetical protein [Paludibacter sp.]